MNRMYTRRTTFLTPLIALPWLFGRGARADDGRRIVEDRLRELEIRSGGHLGVAVLDTATGQVIGNRLDERFALCSTFKALAIAFTLARVIAEKRSWTEESSSAKRIWLCLSRRLNRTLLTA